MADKTAPLVLEGLGRAAAEPAGFPLLASKAGPGLFAATAAGRQAAQACKDAGYLHVLRSETRGKATQEICAVTEKGLAFLLGQVSPRPVLEEFVRAVQAREAQAGELLATARQLQATLEALRAAAERVLMQAARPAGAIAAVHGNGSDTWKAQALSYLARWQAAHPNEDCSLPELYAQARQAAAGLTIGHFHDGLRRLHEQGQIYLHPWTGPLYDIPEPGCALLVGHEVAYYASLRNS